eukprot:comp19089_c0_seq1/m.35429 comp19089_c0_seq1/g.35429  ORF comp19089_c0_seq1/g.35429 comp19089_c0_seq1/m.35429 type:complete len:432 (-) comp19089_c0_seq1:4-1299(-)
MKSWREAVSSLPVPASEPSAETRSHEEGLFLKEFSSLSVSETDRLPRFYFKRPTTKDTAVVHLRREARTRFLQRKSIDALSEDEASALWVLLERMSSSTDSAGRLRINYDAFCAVAAEMGEKSFPFFTPAEFLKFELDDQGSISIAEFFQYVVRQISLAQIRVGFCFYDSAGYGYLREEDLENYIFELIPTLPHLASLGQEFYPFYTCTAVRKFFFFLDPGRKGKIGIKQMLTSPILAEFFELRGEDLSEEDLQFNWFSAKSAQRVYGQYLQLDVDRNGMLSRAELARIGDGTLTDIVLDRLFEENHTYSGEMDYKSFLDLVLAMENKKSTRGLEYFWRLLDVNNVGYITSFTINLFFRDVQRKLIASRHEPPNVADVKDEIFDMVKPEHPYRITLKDLKKCGCGDTIISILTDLRGFFMYENRENATASL